MEKLTSFEFALRAAGLSQFNLVHVSAYSPLTAFSFPGRGRLDAPPGEIVYCVLSSNHTDERSRLVGSAIGVAIPEDRKRYGYISEHHAYGKRGRSSAITRKISRRRCSPRPSASRSILRRAWNERKQEWKIARQIVRTTNITQTALGKTGCVTTTVRRGGLLQLHRAVNGENVRFSRTRGFGNGQGSRRRDPCSVEWSGVSYGRGTAPALRGDTRRLDAGRVLQLRARRDLEGRGSFHAPREARAQGGRLAFVREHREFSAKRSHGFIARSIR